MKKSKSDQPTQRSKILALLAKGLSRADVALVTNCHQGYVRAVIRRGETGSSAADIRYRKNPKTRAKINARNRAKTAESGVRAMKRKLIQPGDDHGSP